MANNPIPVKKSSTPDWYMAGEHAGTEGDPSEPIVIAKGPSDVALATEALQTAGNASLASIKTAVEGATPAGSAIIGKVGIDQVTANANEVVVKSITAGPLPDTTTSDFAAIHAHLAAVETLLQTTGITILPLDSSIDSIDVDKMTKGAVTVAHSAITGTATSAEIDCRGYNSLLVHWVSNRTDKTWVISVTGAMGSGLIFVPLLDKTTGLAASEITTDISGFFVISNIPDYVKIVATETDDGATVTCKVQPFNS